MSAVRTGSVVARIHGRFALDDALRPANLVGRSRSPQATDSQQVSPLRESVGERSVIDYYRPVADSAATPLLVFFHGHESVTPPPDEMAFVARQYLQRGIAVAIVHCSFAGFGGIREQLTEAARALRWLIQGSATLGIDAGNVLLAGWGVGASIAAYLGSALPSYVGPPIRSVVGLCGIYWFSSLVQQLKADGDRAFSSIESRRLSPAQQRRFNAEKFVIAVGSRDAEDIRVQGKSFARRLSSLGVGADFVVVQGGAGAALVDAFADGRSSLFTRTCECLGKARG